MLVLQRSVDKSVVIRDADNRVVCRVMVVEVRGQNVRLGFEAPRGVHVNRDEIDKEIQRNGRQ